MEGVEERCMEIRGREDLIFLIVLFVFCKKRYKMVKYWNIKSRFKYRYNYLKVIFRDLYCFIDYKLCIYIEFR